MSFMGKLLVDTGVGASDYFYFGCFSHYASIFWTQLLLHVGWKAICISHFWAVLFSSILICSHSRCQYYYEGFWFTIMGFLKTMTLIPILHVLY